MNTPNDTPLSRAVRAHLALFNSGNGLIGDYGGDPDDPEVLAFDQALDDLRQALLDLGQQIGETTAELPRQITSAA